MQVASGNNGTEGVFALAEPRTAYVAFSGDLDVYRRDEISAALPAAGSVDQLVIDMRGASLIDSSVIAVLMHYRREFVDAGGNAHEVVVVVPQQLRRIFEITGLTKSLTVVNASSASTEQTEVPS